MPISNPGVIPAASLLTVAETEVFSGASPVGWTDLDLSAVIGAVSAEVTLKRIHTAGGGNPGTYAFRKNGDTDEHYKADNLGGCALADCFRDVAYIFKVVTDATGKIEWTSQAGSTDDKVYVISDIKPA